jgi:hypothetical protein
MRSGRHSLKPGFDTFEDRLVPTIAGPNPPIVQPILSEFAKAYLSHVGQPSYNPVVDVNHTGFIGMAAGVKIVKSLAPITPKAVLTLTLTLAPGQQANTPHPANSGGVTRKTGTITIIGHTVPNSLVFTDDKNNDFKFRGGSVIPVDSSGFFSTTVTLTSKATTSSYLIGQHNFLVIDPFGQQLRRAFPILQLPA